MLGITGRLFPPAFNDMLKCSNTFRCKLTFGNYLGYVRTGCLIVGAPTDVFRDVALKRAKMAIGKRGQFVPRVKLFVQRKSLVKIIDIATRLQDRNAAMLFLAAYVFLLRVPSEGLPMRKGGDGIDNETHQSVIALEGEEVVLRLARRKNRPLGSVLRRFVLIDSCLIVCHVSCGTQDLLVQPVQALMSSARPVGFLQGRAGGCGALRRDHGIRGEHAFEGLLQEDQVPEG